MRFAAAVILLGFVVPAAALPPVPGALRSPIQPPLAEDAPWPVARGDAHNTGRVGGEAHGPEREPPAAPWRFPTGGGVVAAPVIDASERIYVGAADGMLYAFDPFGGRELWRVPVGAPVVAAAALGADGVIYVVAGPRLSALAADGATRWTFDARRDRDRRRVTLGIADAWQGGVVIGPGGDACAGNDDFFFYCLEPGGQVAWAARTGLPVWAVAAFGHDGTVYVPSLDMHLYALEPDTGAVRWRRDLGAPLGASAAVGDDGTIYVAALDGQVHALDGSTGAVRWSMRTGGPVVAPAAIAGDGTVYVASTDGRLYALDGASGALRWVHWFGDPVRSSPAIGPDPEGGAAHLVYVGGSDGKLYALTPDGRRRWTYDTEAALGTEVASTLAGGPALGRYGVAVGAAAGAVLYVPYDYYLRGDAHGISRPLASPCADLGPRWRVVSPAGVLDQHPLATTDAEAETITVGRAQAITLRPVEEVDAARVDPVVLPDGIAVRGTRTTYRTGLLGDRRTLTVVPQTLLPGGATVPLSLSGRYTAADGTAGSVEGRVVFQTEPESVENPIALRRYRGFRVSNVTLSQPVGVATLLAAGTGAISIPFVVVESLPARRTFVGWGLQRAKPVDAGGSARRVLLFALRGGWSGDAFVLDAESVFVDVGGVTVPVDDMRLGGRFAPGGRTAPGATALVTLRPPGLWGFLQSLMVNGAVEGAPPTWLGDILRRGSLVELTRAAAHTVPAVARLVARRVWEPLGLVNPDGDVVAVGTFDLTPLSAAELAAPRVHVRSLVPEPAAGRVVAEVVVEASPAGASGPVLAILLVDTMHGGPVPLDYNRLLSRERLPDGSLRVQLTIPPKAGLIPGRTRAHVMADLASVAVADF